MTDVQVDKPLEVPKKQRRTDDGDLSKRFQEERPIYDRGLREWKKGDTAARDPVLAHTDTSSALLGKEINHRGPATFPFGETLFLRAVMSQQIEQDMSEKGSATRRLWWSEFGKWDLPDVELGENGRGDTQKGTEKFKET